ncbi:hypothetical protein P7K49_007381, partial [Saguinus oedipus]
TQLSQVENRCHEFCRSCMSCPSSVKAIYPTVPRRHKCTLKNAAAEWGLCYMTEGTASGPSTALETAGKAEAHSHCLLLAQAPQ